MKSISPNFAQPARTNRLVPTHISRFVPRRIDQKTSPMPRYQDRGRADHMVRMPTRIPKSNCSNRWAERSLRPRRHSQVPMTINTGTPANKTCGKIPAAGV
ncbi:hypothetical protein GCM10017711_14620 [Paeniglutamicibacter sulfureus]